MKESFELQTLILTNKKTLFNAWLNSKEHSAFTGGDALIDPVEGGIFSAWDGYIVGRTITIEEHSKIVQHWRTSKFSIKDSDSLLELLFEAKGAGTLLTLRHSNIPKKQGESYKQGWNDHYFEPMKQYFV